MAIEMIFTLFASIAALWKKRDALSSTLFAAWVASFCFAILAWEGVFPTGLIPLAATVIDVAIALAAIMLWTDYDSQRARIVGVISWVKLLFHFGISFHLGSGDWFIYALLVNLAFIGQCVIAGGWIHGLADFLNRVSPRRPRSGAPNNKG